jgi:hypothetical protein
MRKNDSWGINWSILENMDQSAYLYVITEKARYSIRVRDALDKGEFLHFKRDALDKGEFLHFKTQGFERQFFVPVKEWETVEN